jgi:triacylglycerol lipase
MRISFVQVLACLLLLAATSESAYADDCVILLHGLARTSSSMKNLAEAFEERGYAVANIDYPSRQHPVEVLASMAVNAGIDACPDDSVIFFVTHSLGGILVRYYLEHDEIQNLGRVVMLAPPNQGSQVVDKFGKLPGFGLLNGPAGSQLGTDKDSIPSNLGPVDYEVGVIAGSETFNPILSQALPNPDDGKVSVDNTKVDGMRDFIVVLDSHPFIMRSEVAIAQAISFVETGSFVHDEP